MKKTLLACFAFVSLTFFAPLSASHMTGAEITYKYISGTSYLITAKFYRDCRGIAFNNPTFGVKFGSGSSWSCGTTALSFSRISISDVTAICKSGTKPCNPVNTAATGEGIEEHIYTYTADLSKSPFTTLSTSGCCEVMFYAGQCCRSGAITTGLAGKDFVVTSTINFCNLKKCLNKNSSSPKLTSAPQFMVCCNSAVMYNYGAIDTVDNDLIKYAFTPALQTAPNTLAAYSTPWTYKFPLTPYCSTPGTVSCKPTPEANPPRATFLDTMTGMLTYTPTKCDEVAPIVVEITEWRKDSASGQYILIGRIMREAMIIVMDNCGYNKSPRIEKIAPKSIVEGDNIKFEIKCTDTAFTPFQTKGDTVDVTWNNAIGKGSSIKYKDSAAREKIIIFEWQTKKGMGKELPYTFVLKSDDRRCNLPMVVHRAFEINVKKLVNAKLNISASKCNTLLLKATLDSGVNGSTTYTWKVKDSATGLIEYTGYQQNDSSKSLSNGKKYVSLEISNAYYHLNTTLDSITIKNGPSLSLGADFFACPNSTVIVTATTANTQPTLQYQWSSNVNYDPPVTGNTYKIAVFTKDSTVKVLATDGNGCKLTDTVKIKAFNTVKVKWNVKSQPARCFRDRVIDLDPLFNGGNTSNTLIWDAEGNVIALGGGKFRFDGNKLNNNNLQTVDHVQKVFGQYTDSNGCKILDTTTVRISGDPRLLTKDSKVCQDIGSVQLAKNVIAPTGSSFNSLVFQEWKLLSAPSGVDLSQQIVNLAIAGGQDYWLEFGTPPETKFGGDYVIQLKITYKTTGCYTMDTFTITVTNEAVIKLNSYPASCSNREKSLQPYADIDGIPPSSGAFKIISFNGDRNHANVKNTILVNGISLPKTAPYGKWEILVSGTNSNCVSSDSFIVELYPSPKANFTLTPDSVDLTAPYSFITNNQSTIADNSSMTWEWNAGTGNSNDNSTSKDYTVNYPNTKANYNLMLIAKSDKGCLDTFVRKVYTGASGIYGPEITEAGFYFNKLLQLQGAEIKTAIIHWYDASGKLVHTDRTNAGTLLPAGIYIYKIQLIDGSGIQKEFSGRWPVNN